ncbi:MAG: HD domain-containing protein [Actinobacteria bacterium]|nr:MAG: HD domain-containing protein [Actinomycetota bacterium]
MNAPLPTTTDVRASLASRLSERSLGHCERVAAAAASLASEYGLNPKAAELAGLLHDWHRDAGDDDLLASAEELGLDVDEVERARPYLLHARTAAAEVRREFPGIGEDVVHAVEAHTLGSVGMSDLAKAVYVADMIEPARSWEGVDELRASVGEVGLDELFFRAYQRTLCHLVAKRKRIHPRAHAVWESLVEEVRP